MKYRKLGKTELSVSEIGLGTAQLGGPSLIAGRYWGSPKIARRTAVEILEKAFDSGINFFDSSDKYGDGEAERLLGDVFKAKRQQVIFATKCGITSSGERSFDRHYIRSCLEESLRNLKTDCIDIFQLTKPDLILIKEGDLYNILDTFKKEGKIRFSGISTGSDEGTAQLIVDNRVDTLQIFYNLLHIEPNKKFIEKAFDKKLGLIIRSPLSSGVLTGKYNYNTKFSEEDARSAFLDKETLRERLDIIEEICRQFKVDCKKDILKLSLNYLLSNEKVSTIIPGAKNVNQLTGLLGLSDVNRLSDEEFEKLEDCIQKLL